MNILGISAGFHDAGITLTRNSDILYASHSERYSGRKHDSNLNIDMINDAVRLLPEKESVDLISYYERPWVRLLRQIRTGERYCPTRVDFSIRSMLPAFLQTTPIQYQNHHKSHAASSFQTSSFDRATCIVIDAIGEFDTISIWNASYNKLGHAEYKKIWGKSYPDSIGMMYSAFTARVGLKPMDDEYILMGMAAYGDSAQQHTIRAALVDNDLNFQHNLHTGLPDEFMQDADSFDLAASAQAITEQLIAQVFAKAIELGHSSNLCYSGGVALNCVANDTMAKLCDQLWIMPNPGDAGASMGAAALAYGKQLNWQHPYLGYDINPYTEYPVDQILAELHLNKIVGVAHGRAEFGPRALGNRSLVADPRGAEIKDQVNQIKRRQKFRPFAPMILEEYVNNYFVMPDNVTSSPYMQFTGVCRYPELFPAIVHKDGTSRVQTVTASQHPGLYRLLKRWYSETACPMLLNTSLNIRGYPMVNTVSDANAFEDEYNVKVIS